MKAAYLLAALLAASSVHADPPGYSPREFALPHHDRAATGAVFYPTDDGGLGQIVGGNPVFQGVLLQEGAALRAGRHPVVLLSHGMGGTVRSLAWLAAGLAERGAIVVAVNHPNSTWGDFDVARATAHWTRAQDLSAALDGLLADPRFANGIDHTRIMAAGFSLGGWTALSLGGLRGNHAGYRAHCAVYGEASSHCGDLLRHDVSLDDIPDTRWNASYRDPRVTHVAAIDPGLIWGLGQEEVAGVIGPVRLIGLGMGRDRLLATDFDASGLADLLDGAQVSRLAPARHFTALPLCTPAGAAILEAEGEDPVCTDPPDADRAAIHARVIAEIAADLGL
ncbi:MAG: hypothetical protein AAGG09_09890 [Pseudomonadota bacterium]